MGAVCLLVYLNFESIMGPIRFDEQKSIRDKATIARLIDIRKAQIEYRNQKGTYTASFDSLTDFVKHGTIPFVLKVGSLTDAQLEAGLTEKRAMEIIRKGKEKDIELNGLTNFRRDTIFVAVIDTIYPKGFNADSLRYVPFTQGRDTFEMATGELLNASGYVMRLFEAKTPYRDYLNGLDNPDILHFTANPCKIDKYYVQS